jgi:hypothetical protein
MNDYLESLGKWQVLYIEKFWQFQAMYQRYGIGKVIEKWQTAIRVT